MMPHVWVKTEFARSAWTLVNVRPEAASTGVNRLVCVPSPSCPEKFAPQQSVWPFVAIPHEWIEPDEMKRNCVLPEI